MVLLPPPSMTTIDGRGGDGNNYGYDQPFAWGSLQPPPLGGAIGHDVCLTVVGNGVVGLGVKLLLVRLLVGGPLGMMWASWLLAMASLDLAWIACW